MGLLARDRVRRLYCLECGDGSYTSLPATWFVEQHVKKHNIKEEDADKSFLVVERPIDDNTIKLDDKLTSMFQKTFLEWGGAASAATKYADRAKQKGGAGI